MPSMSKREIEPEAEGRMVVRGTSAATPATPNGAGDAEWGAAGASPAHSPAGDGKETEDLPSAFDVFCDFNGSMGFVVGSSGFILSAHFADGDWLPYFRYGSIAWIWGCIWYLVPLAIKLGLEQWGPGDLGEFLCNAAWFAGCVLGGFFGEADVERLVPAINHLFLYGSCALLLGPAWGVVRGCCRARPPDRRTGRTRRLDRVDLVLELLMAVFFVLAGWFGGFPLHPSHMLPGMYFWEVGSLFGLGRSFVLLARRRGRSVPGGKGERPKSTREVEMANEGD